MGLQRAGRAHQRARAGHRDALVRPEAGVHVAVVGEHVGHREDPRVPGLGEHVDPGPGQDPAGRHQPVVDAVDPADDPAHLRHVQLGHRRAGQHAGLRARRDERAHRVGGELDVGVEIHPGKRRAVLVAQPHRGDLARHRGLDDAHTRHGRGDRGGVVLAGVRHDDDLELARCGAGQQLSQVVPDDRGLVVGRDDNAHDRDPHGATIA
ncbi:hypothetical protein GCM10018962_94500 [Dactylosporangium matsuzakiense]|uniref:Uncharacterized protein n=1 Tax=Dactylosporangium matsuzakiense TaxID=53360 RepID=A0A9W6KU26_9ACTN|nr:hypothetical protein GCM10017581_089520 [Dactylosporangium matsuzakiense]